jgi:hypothetical protein
MKNPFVICGLFVAVGLPLGGFVLGLLGHIGSLHHAAHVAAAIIGIELIFMGVVSIFRIAYLLDNQ